LNFDHVLAEELTTGDWHGWYGLPAQLTNWTCPSEFVLELTTSGKYYPLLQELSYIRPLRMLSPAKFVGGITSDPYTSNSCPSGWGHIPGTSGRPNVTCAGTTGIAGTGRWEYIETIYNNETSGDVNTVTFQRNANHWAASADTTQLDYVHLKKYETSAEVKNALASGELDAVIGAGVLENEDVADFQTNSSFTVSLTESFQNRVVIFNTAKAPTDDLETRKMIIHAVNKADIIDRELAGIDAPVDSLFPKNAPYCDIHFTPTWDFDLEKARLLCGAGDSSSSSSSVDGGILAMALIFAALVMMLTGMLCFMRKREINGKPLFRPLVAADRKQVEMRA
jgi:nickel transport system substrate-binding protein